MMNGPSDEIEGPRDPDAGLRYLGEVTALGPVEDTPIEGQEHLRAHQVPIGTREGDMVYRGLDEDGQPVWERIPEHVPVFTDDGSVLVVDEFTGDTSWHNPLALAARDGVPRSSPKTRRPLREMFDEDERKKRAADAERERLERLRASGRLVDQLELYMHYLTYAKGRYDDYQIADDVIGDVLNALRGEVLHRPELDVQAALREAWSDGYAEGAGYIGACCGCSGRGEPPANPYGED